MQVNEEKVRLFIAVDLPHAVIEEVQRVQRYFKKKNVFEGRYPGVEAMHLTTKFLGDTSVTKIDEIREALRSVRAVPMQAALDRVHFFGDAKHMKVVFIKLKSPFLTSFAQSIDLALMPGFPAEERDFVGHITVARVKQVYDVERAVDAIYNCEVKPLSFVIDSFVLKQSVLSSSGPEHHDIERYVLRGAKE